VQAALLGANPQVGLFQAISGSLTLDEAMQPVQTGRAEALDDGAAPPGAVATMLGARRAGTLSVVLGQRGVANPPALLETPAMRAVLRSAAEEYDQVVVDAPSPLQVSDAMSLLSQVDGIVLVARAGHTRETSAHRLVQLLARTPSAPVLGVVVNDVSRSDAERYGFSDTRPQRSWAVKLIGG
jgi:Mrp family chromosome partitioning ATPase